MQYLMIGIFFGVVTGAVGKAKGSSFFIWFAVGIILPAIGLVAAIMSRSEKLEPLRECPSCGRLLPVTTQVCMRCGEDLDFPEEFLVPARKPAATPEHMPRR